MAQTTITPSSTITLYSAVRITPYQQIVFKSATNQAAYFSAHTYLTNVGCSYVRRNGSVKIAASMSEVLNTNYMSFTNPAFEGKTIYARVSDVEYVNNATCRANFSIDWFQTFLFDFDVIDSFIEREQLSQYTWNLAQTNPTFNCKDIYQMISSENLNVSEEWLENPTVEYYPTTDDIGTDYGNTCALFEIAIPASTGMTITSSTVEMGTSTSLSDSAILKILTLFDGFNNLNTVARLGIPVSEIVGWVDTTVSDAASRIREILDILTENDLLGQLIGYYGVAKWVAASYSHYYAFSVTYNNAYTYGVSGIAVAELGTYAGQNYGGIYSVTITPEVDTTVHPKLNMFPYTFLQLSLPDGTTKDFMFERSAYTNMQFRIIPVCTGSPVLYVFPLSYRQTSGINIAEMMNYSGFPQLPYATDNFLTYLASQYTSMGSSYTQYSSASALAGATTTGLYTAAYNEGSNNLETVGNTLLGVAGVLGSTISTVTGLASGDTSSISSLTSGISSANETRSKQTQINDIKQGVNPASTGYENARASIVSSAYTPGSGGYYPLLNLLTGQSTPDQGSSGCCIKVSQRQLLPSVKSAFNDYLNEYGVTTNRRGTPLLYNYIHGSTSTSSIPQFVTINGVPTTYVKTTAMSVVCSWGEASDYIETVFNTGMRFLQGESLS